jgi:ABC-type ATPase with predicted acetyltransferase domain
MYNDVGLQVRDKVILLIEAQSTFSVNVVLRILLYLATTYKEYVEEHKLNLYGTAAVKIPRPELYVVYTGDQENVPEMLLLSDLYGGTGDAEVRVKVLRGTGNGDIVDQYVCFCKIADEERKRHGRTGKAIEETLRRCIAENVLVPFLTTRQKEVAEIMVTLFDQEKIMEIHDYHVAEAAREDGLQIGRIEGHAEGRIEGRVEGMLSSIKSLMETLGLSIEAAMNALKVPEDERGKYVSMLKQ